MKIFLQLIGIALLCNVAAAQNNPDRYVTSGDLVARVPLHLSNGFMFVSFPIIDTSEYGIVDTTVRSFLIDPRASNEGNYLPRDSSENMLGNTIFYSPVSKQRTLKFTLAPTFAKIGFRKTDSTFFGVIGYAFLRQYMSVFDFVNNTLSLYSLEPEPVLSKRLDIDAIAMTYFDDAILSYCHCQFPTMWVEPDIAPLNKGRMHLSLADRMSVLYESALPQSVKKEIAISQYKDSVAGKPQKFSGVEIKNFSLSGQNIAPLEPHRYIDKLPDVFKDLNITVTGTIAMDLIHRFKALIIEPQQALLLFCKY